MTIKAEIIRDLDFALYLEIPALSKSLLSQITRSPAHLQQRKITPMERTPAMAIGSAVDCLTFDGERAFALEYTTAPMHPEELPDGFKPAPEGYKGTTKADKAFRASVEEDGGTVVKAADWNGSGLKLTTAAGKAWRANVEANGWTVLAPSQMRQIRECHAAILASAPAAPYLTGGHAQESMVWKDEDTGLWLKGRTDYRVGDVIVDLKTTDDADGEQFARKAFGLKYHWQAALYCDGMTALTGRPHDQFVFVVAERDAPYRVEVYEVPASILEQGREEVAAALALYAQCEAAGEWPSSSGRVQSIVFKPWMVR